jgi:hypothetical protein
MAAGGIGKENNYGGNKMSYEDERQSYLEPYVPAVAPKGHWTESTEWQAVKAARQKATKFYPADSVHASRVDDSSPEIQQAMAAFAKAYPPDEPEPTPVLTPRDAEIQAATIDLKRACDRLRAFAHTDRILKMVSDHLAQ